MDTVATGATPRGAISAPPLRTTRIGAGPMELKHCLRSHLSNRGSLCLDPMRSFRTTPVWLMFSSPDLLVQNILARRKPKGWPSVSPESTCRLKQVGSVAAESRLKRVAHALGVDSVG